MSNRDRATTLGLNTDLPPDLLEERALRLMDVVPASPVSVRPRFGSQLIEHYSSVTLGRQLVVDALPLRSDDRLLLVAINNRDDGEGGTNTTMEGLEQFKPKVIAGSTLESIAFPGGPSWTGAGTAENVYGWVV
jgi:hypothetical protein